MNKFKYLVVVLTVILLFSCTSRQIGLKENWIDERDVMALRDMPIEQWIERAGLPTLVEIVGDTNVYYYNYRPTLYAVAVYDSTTTFLKSWGTASEQKPSLANKTEVWGSRKDVMQIKVLKGAVLSAIVTEGPDKKVFIRDLTGNIVLDPNSGYNSNISEEQKVNNSFKEFSKIFSNLQGATEGQTHRSAPTVAPTVAPAAVHPAGPVAPQHDSAATEGQTHRSAPTVPQQHVAPPAQHDSAATEGQTHRSAPTVAPAAVHPVAPVGQPQGIAPTTPHPDSAATEGQTHRSAPTVPQQQHVAPPAVHPVAPATGTPTVPQQQHVAPPAVHPVAPAGQPQGIAPTAAPVAPAPAVHPSTTGAK